MSKLKNSMMSVAIKDKAALYDAYMSFLSNGGLFITSNKKYALGDEIFLRLTLMDESEKFSVPATVVWITPAGSQGNRQQGVGVQFSEYQSAVQIKIESYLMGSVMSNRPTSTM